MTGTAAEIKIDRNHLIKEIHGYHTSYDVERGYIGPFLELLENPRCFHRDCFPGHITGSSILINPNGDKILMNHHGIIKKWMNFGGHADGEEDILAVAIRETMEETGITAFKPLTASFMDLDIHPIPENSHKGEPEHFHYDVRYVMQMTDEQPAIISDESLDLKWMTWDDAYDAILGNERMKRYMDKARELIS